MSCVSHSPKRWRAKARARVPWRSTRSCSVLPWPIRSRSTTWPGCTTSCGTRAPRPPRRAPSTRRRSSRHRGYLWLDPGSRSGKAAQAVPVLEAGRRASSDPSIRYHYAAALIRSGPGRGGPRGASRAAATSLLRRGRRSAKAAGVAAATLTQRSLSSMGASIHSPRNKQPSSPDGLLASSAHCVALYQARPCSAALAFAE